MRRASPTCCRVFCTYQPIYIAPLYNPYNCFSFDFDHLKLNYSKSADFILFCKTEYQPSTRNFPRYCKILVSRQPKTNFKVKYQIKAMWRDQFEKIIIERLKLKRDMNFPLTVQISPWCWQKKKELGISLNFKFSSQSSNYFKLMKLNFVSPNRELTKQWNISLTPRDHHNMHEK